MFRGVTHLALDNKGRLAIPAKHREALLARADGHMVLTADPSRCLLLYPFPEWEPIQKRLMALSSFNDKIRGLQRLLVGHADDVELDGAGRILVPPSLRQFATLDKHVVLVGQGNKFELWDEEQWQGRTAQAVAFPAAACHRADGFSLPMAITFRSCSKKPWRHWRQAHGIYVDGTFGAAGILLILSARAMAGSSPRPGSAAEVVARSGRPRFPFTALVLNLPMC